MAGGVDDGGFPRCQHGRREMRPSDPPDGRDPGEAAMTHATTNEVQAGQAKPDRPASQRDLVIQSLIRRPDDPTKRGVR
jgi:hypothetical protein